MESKKHLGKLMDIEVKHDMLQDEINEAKEKEIERQAQDNLDRESKFYSIVGHLSKIEN